MKSNTYYKNICKELKLKCLPENKGYRGSVIQDAADAILELLEELNRHGNTVEVDTPKGTLVARDSGGEPDYPGIHIFLRRGSDECLLDLVEYTATEGDAKGTQIISRVYGDGLKDEYTIRIIHTNLAEYFEQLSCENPSALETSQILSLSTAHLEKSAAEKLDDDDVQTTVYRKEDSLGKHGWFVCVPTDMDSIKSEEVESLRNCLLFASQRGFQWIMFDNDVRPIAELRAYNWD